MPMPSLFVMVPRTGNTSIWTWLCSHGGEPIELGPNRYRFPLLDCVTTMHWPAKTWRRLAKGRFVFGFCRDTYTRLESIAAYRGYSSLARFVKHIRQGCIVPMLKYGPKMNFAAPQATWLAWEKTLAVDFLGEQERLDQDFARLCVTLGWPERKLPHKNHRPRTFSDGWTDEMRRVVQSVYREDFLLLGDEKVKG